MATSMVNGVCAVHTDGRDLLASASDDRTVRLWDPATGQTVLAIPVHHEALGLASFAEGRRVVGPSTGLLVAHIT